MSSLLTGYIARFYPEKNFGFIRLDGTKQRDFFFHMDDLYEETDKSRLINGTRVTFFERHTDKGPRAENVRLV